MSIACFISPHGYGHAARATAVMEAFHHLDPEKEFEIFTQVPESFFRQSLSGAFTYHPLLTDVGLVQETSLKADLSETLTRLDSLEVYFLVLPSPHHSLLFLSALYLKFIGSPASRVFFSILLTAMSGPGEGLTKPR